MYIESENIIVRKMEEKDVSIIGNWWRDGRIMEHAGFPNGLSITDDEIILNLKANDCKRYVIISEGNIIGEMSYVDRGDEADIGIKICDTSKREIGIGTKCLKLFIDELFKNYSKITLNTDINNTRAQHVYEKLGFVKTDVRLNCWKDQVGVERSSVYYELTNKKNRL